MVLRVFSKGRTQTHTHAKKRSGRWDEWLFGGFGRVVVGGRKGVWESGGGERW